MFYTMEEAAVLGGFLELYLERDSVDPAVRERHRKISAGADARRIGTGRL